MVRVGFERYINNLPSPCPWLLCRWEAHLWVKELGRQVYLGGYENEEHAAEAYDVAALKCKGPRVRTNFPLSRWVPLFLQL
jgi:hypothetical protein